MKSKVIIIIVAAIIFMLYRTNPTFDDHVSMITSEYLKSDSAAEEPKEKISKALDYSNFLILSVTKDKSILAVVSIGAMNRVKILDAKWAGSALK